MAESTKKAARRTTLKNRYFCKTTTTGEGASRTYDSQRIDFENPEYAHLTHKEYVARTSVTPEQKSPAMELYLATDRAYNIQARGTLELVKGPFSKENENSWFKFVLVLVNGEPKLYIIYGNDEQNKHSVCFLYAMYENIPRQESSKLARSDSGKSGSTKSASDKSGSTKSATAKRSSSRSPRESGSPRASDVGFHSLMDQVIALDETSGTPITEETPHIINLNKEIYNKFRCMDVIVSGSATYLGQHEGVHILCINTKSGHYLPDLESLSAAVSEYFPLLFPRDEAWAFTVRENVTNMADLEALYGKANHKRYTGTCLTDREIASLPELRAERKSRMLAEKAESKSKKPGKKAAAAGEAGDK